MARTYVDHPHHDHPHYDRDHNPITRRAGWFSPEAATYWHGDKALMNGVNLVDVNTRDQHRGEGLYRTRAGHWVLRAWSNWQGESDRHTYVDDHGAREWLIVNSYDAAVEEHFGEIEEERGPGRPEIGGLVNVRLGDLLDATDAYAAHRGVSRAEAVRMLVRAGLDATS